VLEIFEQIFEEAKTFDNDNKWGERDVNAIYINWIGFCLNPDSHTFMGENESPVTYVNDSASKSSVKSGVKPGRKSSIKSTHKLKRNSSSK
jgi:hypothetical protein